MDRVVIVGASLAGVHAAEALREFGFEREIVLVGAEDHLPYERPPLSKEALATGPQEDELVIRSRGWFDDKGVDLRLATTAHGLDSARSVVHSSAGDIQYDGLVIATGSGVRTLGMNTPGVHVLRTIEDARSIHESLRAQRELVIIGAGFIGLEVAATAAELGVDVTIIELAPEPLSRVLGDRLGEWFRLLFIRRGVRFLGEAVITSVDRDADDRVRVTGNFGEVVGDMAVLGIGAQPSIGWLRGSDVALADGVVCDETLATNIPGVVAAGDVARWYNPLFDESMRIEQWTNAVEQGRHAAATLLGEKSAYSTVPYLWSDLFDVRMRFVGRSYGADEVLIHERGDNSLVGVFGRHGVQIGAVCINTTSEVGQHREAIANRREMPVAVGE